MDRGARSDVCRVEELPLPLPASWVGAAVAGSCRRAGRCFLVDNQQHGRNCVESARDGGSGRGVAQMGKVAIIVEGGRGREVGVGGA